MVVTGLGGVQWGSEIRGRGSSVVNQELNLLFKTHKSIV